MSFFLPVPRGSRARATVGSPSDDASVREHPVALPLPQRPPAAAADGPTPRMAVDEEVSECRGKERERDAKSGFPKATWLEHNLRGGYAHGEDFWNNNKCVKSTT